jgi:hypothetical protein
VLFKKPRDNYFYFRVKEMRDARRVGSLELVVLAHVCNACTVETEAGESQVPGQSGLHIITLSHKPNAEDVAQ